LKNLNFTFSIVSLKTNNDVTKRLTIFSVFFMPLTILARTHEINFGFIPALQRNPGYPIVLLVMALIVRVIFREQPAHEATGNIYR